MTVESPHPCMLTVSTIHMVPHFFGLTNFPDFSSIFHSFPVFLKVLFYLKYGTIFAGFSLLLADKFP